MSADIASRQSSSLAGAGLAGVGLMLRRPDLLLAWTLLALPLAVILIAATRWLSATASFGLPGLFVVGAAAVRMVGVMTQCAAYRAVLRPDMGGWGLVRLGATEWRVLFTGFGRNPAGVPLEVFAALFVGVLCMVGVVVLVSVVLGITAGAITFGLGMVAFLAAINVANVRGSLIGVAAFVASPEPLATGWARGQGRTLAMVGNAIVVALICLTVAGPVVALAWQGSSVWLTPSALWAPGLPLDPAGWIRLSTEGGLLALVCSFLFAFFAAAGEPVMAETWLRTGGSNLLQQRRRLFEGP